MKRPVHKDLDTTPPSKKPFDWRKFSQDSISSESVDSTLSFGSVDSSFPEYSSLLHEPREFVITKFIDKNPARPNLTVYGRDYSIPCHDFPLCAKSESLRALIQQPSNALKQSVRFDDKVSREVAVEFITMCYDWDRECEVLQDPYDFMQLYFLIDMHFTDKDKEKCLNDLTLQIRFIVHKIRLIQQERLDRKRFDELDKQACGLFFVAYELNLPLLPKTWMSFLTHFGRNKMQSKLKIEHLNFLATKRRPQDYQINQRFFKFLLNLVALRNAFSWNQFDYEWGEVQDSDLRSLTRWVDRQTPNNKTKILNTLGHVLHHLYMNR